MLPSGPTAMNLTPGRFCANIEILNPLGSLIGSSGESRRMAIASIGLAHRSNAIANRRTVTERARPKNQRGFMEPARLSGYPHARMGASPCMPDNAPSFRGPLLLILFHL